MPDIFFEDLVPGTVTSFGRRRVSSEEITAFARDYDAQPFHLGEETARNTFVGRQIASGWHTIALQMRMVWDSWLWNAASMGGPGVDELLWVQPVFPGDELTVRQTIRETRPSRSRPDMGLVHLTLQTLNGRGEVVMRQTNPIMVARRDSSAARTASERPDRAAESGRETPARFDALRPPSGGQMQVVRGFDELEIGATDFMGEHTFTKEEIVAFATMFDPQPFHVDEEAARNSHFGRLAASGWHTAGMWMRHLVKSRAEAIAEASAAGMPLPRFGPSPGFKDLRWLKPVYAGDTIRFATTLVDKRLSSSRPGWGLSFSHNTGWNQHGDKVFEFSGSGFIGRKEAADAA